MTHLQYWRGMDVLCDTDVYTHLYTLGQEVIIRTDIITARPQLGRLSLGRALSCINT